MILNVKYKLSDKSVDGWNPETLDLVIFWLMIQILTHWVCESCKILNIKGHNIREITQTSNMDRKVMSEAACIHLYIWTDKNPTYAFHNCKYVQLLQISHSHTIDWDTEDCCKKPVKYDYNWKVKNSD